MGVWASGLYGNDVTADLTNVFKDLVRLPLDADELIQHLTGIFSGPANTGDERHTSFWLATADLFHRYGIAAPSINERALDIIDSGKDLEMHRELGLSERDLQLRAKALQRLAAKLSQPNERPRNRRLLKEPEPWVFDEGAFIAYPTSQGEPVNPYMPKRQMVHWEEDGWGAFVILGRDRIYGYIAVYLIAVLPPLGPSPPDIRTIIADENTTCVASLVTIPSSHPKKMHLREFGRCPVKRHAIESHFLPGTPPFDFRPQILANALYIDVPNRYPYNHLQLQRFLDLGLPDAKSPRGG